MAKKLDFDKEKNNRNDNVIEEIMQADFPLPKQAEDAKNEAFSRIREMAAASGHLQRTSLWLEMYLSSSVIPWDFMVIIRNMQSS